MAHRYPRRVRLLAEFQLTLGVGRKEVGRGRGKGDRIFYQDLANRLCKPRRISDLESMRAKQIQDCLHLCGGGGAAACWTRCSQ